MGKEERQKRKSLSCVNDITAISSYVLLCESQFHDKMANTFVSCGLQTPSDFAFVIISLLNKQIGISTELLSNIVQRQL